MAKKEKPEQAEGQGRPTNAELYAKEPDIEPDAQPAVDTVHAGYQATKDLEGHVREDGNGYDVVVGKQEGEGDLAKYYILEAHVDMALNTVSAEQRPNEAPGQAKHAEPK